jgi:hypothetical protein
VWGSECISAPFFISELDGGQLHVPAALTSGKKPPVPIEWEAGLAPETVWTLWSRENSVAPDGNQTLAIQFVARRYTDWTNLTPKF